jgi:hypothetical protein
MPETVEMEAPIVNHSEDEVWGIETKVEPIVEKVKEAPKVEEKVAEVVVETKKAEPVIEEKKVEPIIEKKVEETKPANKYLDLLAEGKEDDLYDYFNKKKTIEKAVKSDVSKVSDAEQILKLTLQYKYEGQGLTEDEISDIIEEQYTVPEKPEQKFDETDDDYANTLKKWEGQVEKIQKKIIREAKLAKPDLTKILNELALPVIERPEIEQQKQQSQKELADAQAARTRFEQSLESDFKNFNGYNLSIKDEEVEIPITYSITDEEKALYKQKVADLNVDDYLAARWFDKDGKPNVVLTIDDIYLLENKAKIFQKIANESMAKVLENRFKKESNIDLTRVHKGQQVKETTTDQKQQEDAIWGV